MRVRIYLKSGQVIKLRGVTELTYTPGRHIAWKLRQAGWKSVSTGKWNPLNIDPSQISAITTSRWWWP